MGTLLRLALVSLLIVTSALPMVGCAYRSVDKPIRFDPAVHRGQSRVRAVPYTDEYHVVVRPHAGPVRPWTATRVEATDGDDLGFREQNGSVYAVIGKTEVLLGTPPEGTKYVAWAVAERRMGVTDGPQNGLLLAGQAIVTGVAFTAAIGGVGLLLLWDLQHDDKDDDGFARSRCD